MLQISDMKDDQKVLDHLDDVLFIDSSVTLSEEEYLKRNIQEKLVYEGCISNQLFTVNEDVKMLEEQQITYIFSQNPDDVRILLNLSLASAPIVLKEVDKTEERLKKEMEQQGDIESLIQLTKKAEGSYRIKYVKKEDKSYFFIEPPVVIDPDSLDWSGLNEVEIFNFLNNCLDYAAGVSQGMLVNTEMFSSEIKDFLSDLPRVVDLGFTHARNKTSMNSVSFKTVKDPFKSLFDGVIAGGGDYC